MEIRKLWIIVLSPIHRFLSKILDELNETPFKTKFKSLAPTADIDDPDIYHQALDWALRNRDIEDIKNIAVTGYYGSGKSSVIKNFIKHNCHKYKFLPISLATFKDDKYHRSDSDKSIKEIEESILQQIFYKVSDNEIPNSRFSKIPSKVTLKYFVFSVPLVLFLLGSALYFISDFNESLEWGLDRKQIAYGFIVSGGLSIFVLLWKLKDLTLSKFSVKNLEVDLAEKNNDLSVLNTYIDEIIYFFKVTKYQIVVIEDIDRFETTEIFTKLREINLILNNSEITKDLHIVFIYAIKDDQFENKKDRTKFFDFILPVIPVINLNNSIDKILEIRDSYELGISDRLVKELAVYIDDMRLLLNIFNEFLIYDAQIKDVSRDKLLAIIIYKNLLPDDFALLTHGEGLLFAIINKKQSIIDLKIQELEKEIGDLLKENSIIEKHNIEDVKELRSIYILEYIKSIESTENFEFRAFNVGSSSLTIDEMKLDENFENLIENNIRFDSSRYGVRTFNVQFEEIEKRVNKKQSYKERETLINKKSKNQIAINDRQIAEKKSRMIDIEKSNLDEIITNSIIEETLSEYLISKSENRIASGSTENKNVFNQEIENLLKQKQPIIQSLISNGFIDEDYFMYISIFYEERLTRKDFQYIQYVKNFRKVEYDYKLKNIEEIIEFLNPRNLESDFVFNQDLTEFLLTSKNYINEKKLLFESLSKCKDPAVSFITYFIKNTNYQKEFIQELTQRNQRIWDDLHSSKIENENLQQLYNLILKFGDLNIILGLIEHSSFDAAILNDNDFLIRIDNRDKLKKIISQSGLKLENINFEKSHIDLLNFVYSNNYYSFNRSILLGFYLHRSEEKKNDFLKYPYSIISVDPELTKMYDYIQKDLNNYVNNISLAISENDSEKEKYYLKLLNSKDLSIDNKISLIQKQKTVITSPKEIDDVNLLDVLIKELKILPTWLNLDYITQALSEKTPPTKIPKLVADYLSVKKISQELQNKPLNSEEFSIKNLETLIINLIDIPDERYSEIISKIHPQINMNLSPLDNLKIDILIENEKLLLSNENFLALRKKSPDMVIQFLEKWKLKFVLKLDEYILNSNELKAILKSSKFKAAEKSKIVQSQTAINIKEDDELQVLLANLIIDENQFSAPVSVIFELINVNLKIDRSIKLFNKISGKFSNEQIRSFLKNLKNPFNKLADTSSRPPIPKDSETTKMLETLESRGIISSKKIEGKKYRVYKPNS
ncbi:hypothetical protein E0K83_10110 [Gramella sp. BOM4]|nr:hypothetical protein [Christiangramia bathymodioli]